MITPLKVCIDARQPDATIGGTARVVTELAKAFSTFEGNEEYHFLAFSDANEWIRPYLNGPCRLLPCGTYHHHSLKKQLSRNTQIRRVWQAVNAPFLKWTFKLPASNGVIEKCGFDVVHFTQQYAFLTSIPSIYQPHDLQHLHLPKCFSSREKHMRSVAYPAFCRQARMVVSMSRWGKQDLIDHFQLPEQKVQIIPWGVSALADQPTDSELQQIRIKFCLPEHFLFLPAQTWPHKNHIGLIEALALIRNRHRTEIPLICSGHQNEFFSKINDVIRKKHLSKQIKFIGFVTERELQCLYILARSLVFPTRFEGWGLPVLEAFASGLPVACSNVTCLPALAGGAALIFDPESATDISEKVMQLWIDPGLRANLALRGRQRAEQFSWHRTARMLRAHYRRIAEHQLTPEDHDLLNALPLV